MHVCVFAIDTSVNFIADIIVSFCSVFQFVTVSDYVDKTIVRQLINAGPHVEIANYSQQEQAYGSKFGMIHRFTVAADTTVDRYIVRDVDSRLNYRERFAVEEWIQSGKSIHIMRDQ